MTATLKAGLCQGLTEPISLGIQSFQRNAALHPSAALSPAIPLQELSAPGRGRIPWLQPHASQMHIANIFVQCTFCPPRMLFFREAAAQGNNNNSNSIATATIIIPAAGVLFGSDYRPNTSHKLISVDRLNRPLRQVQFLHFVNEAIEAQQT